MLKPNLSVEDKNAPADEETAEESPEQPEAAPKRTTASPLSSRRIRTGYEPDDRLSRGFARAQPLLRRAFQPEELAARAVRGGIGQIALCDHDTLEGIQPMKRAVAARLLPGRRTDALFPSLELSTGDGNTHVLGYGADTENAVLLRTLEEIRRSRLTRMEEMLERLETLGIHLPEERRARLLVPGTGRAHLARELVGMGLVSTVGASV